MARTVTTHGPHPIDVHVGRQLVQKRHELGRKQTDLAQALGLAFQQVQKYERGANRISASKLWDAATFLGVDINYFFEGLGSEAPARRVAGGEVEPTPVPTRQSVEIGQLSRELSTRQQKLALGLMLEMWGSGGGKSPESGND